MTTANDDKSPLIDLLICAVCNKQMTISSSCAEAGGSELVQYRCDQCDGIETVRLIRRTRPGPSR